MSSAKTFTEQITDYDSSASIGSRLRAKRIAPLLEMIREVFSQHGHVSIIDVGGTKQYWHIVPEGFMQRHNVHITIINLSSISMPSSCSRFTFRPGDGCSLKDFGDGSFHIAHSNSVLEHVGDWSRMIAFARELSRLAENYFVQTPNYWFPIEPHFMTPFFHWLPRPTRIWLISHFNLGNWSKAQSVDEAVRAVESARLLNRRMFQSLFADASVLTEKFCGLPKSFIAVRRKSGSTFR